MSFREALSHRPFAVLVGARALSRVGDSLHEIAIIWLVLKQTGDARLVTLVVVASTLPNVVLSLPAGALVDRFDRRRVLVGADLLRGVAVLAIPLFARGPMLLPVAVTVALFVGVIEPFSGPARSATLPRTVPEAQLDSANALFSLTSSISRTLYVLGGGIVAFVGPYPAFYVDAATFVLSGLVLLTLPEEVGRPDSETEGSGGDGGPLAEIARVIREARDGLGYVLGQPVVLSIIAVGLLVGTLSDPLGIITPVFVEETLGRGSFAYGIVFGAIFVGSAVGDLLVGWLGNRIDSVREETVAVSLGVGGASLAAAGVIAPRTTVPVVVAAGVFSVFGISLSFATTPLDTLLQTTVPNEMLGRVSSVFTVVGMVGPPVALAATGPLVEAFGPTPVLVADGLVVVVSAGLVGIPLIRFRDSASVAASGD